jgi:Flp pilus assembly protein TadD
MSQKTESPTQVVATYDILAAAQLKYKDRDYHGAITEFDRAIELNPSNAEAYSSRGVAHYRLGDLTQAMVDYTSAIEIDPALAIAYYRRGFLHYLAKDYLAAIDDYNKAIELNPTDALAYSNRSYAYREFYGEQEATIDLRFAAKLFREQGNLKKYHSTMRLIDQISGGDSCASGML